MNKVDAMLLLMSATLNKQAIIVSVAETPFENTEYTFQNFNVIADKTRVAIWDGERSLILDFTDIEEMYVKETVASVEKKLVDDPKPNEEIFDGLWKETETERIFKQLEEIGKTITGYITAKRSKLTFNEVFVQALQSTVGVPEIATPLKPREMEALYKKAEEIVVNSIDLPF